MQVYIIYQVFPGSAFLGFVGGVAAHNEDEAIKGAAKRWGAGNYVAKLSA